MLKRRLNIKHTEAFRIAERELEENGEIIINGPTPQFYISQEKHPL